MNNSIRVAITGRTYPVRTELKNMGGIWDAKNKAWMMPAEKAEEAMALVGAGASKGEGRRYEPRVSYWRTSGGSGVSCGCEDYPCCGH